LVLKEDGLGSKVTKLRVEQIETASLNKPTADDTINRTERCSREVPGTNLGPEIGYPD
jgi:hypothetical protein